MSNSHGSAQTDQEGWRLNYDALVDAIIIIVALVAVKQSFLLYDSKFAGPVSTFIAMFVATWRLRARGLTWGELGFKRPDSWWRTLALSGFVFGVIVLGAALGNGIAGVFFDKGYVLNRFGNIEGDIPMYLMWMGLVWTHSAFFEEMLFRAFLINRLSAFLGGSTAATLLSVTLAAIFFGYRHAYYQGPFGFVVTGVIGFGLGLIYVWFGKNNLLPQILAHGYVNSISFTMRFLGIKGD